MQPTILERMVTAVEKVRERLLRSTRALDAAGIPYAVVGGNAVAAWVTQADEAAVRNTPNVDLLVDRAELARVTRTLEAVGLAVGKARDAVHIVFSGEFVRPEEPLTNPLMSDSVRLDEFQVITLSGLVQIKLTAFRDQDRTHLRDLLDVGLIDASWIDRYPAALGDRLRWLIEHPEGSA